MNADIRIYPDKELKAVDMAVILDALEVTDGVIQGCDISLTSGILSISDGRILIKGRLGVVSAGTIELPTLAASATCRLLAVCDLAIDQPFYISLFSTDEYEALAERAATITDFNGTNGVAFVQLGTAEVDASTGTVTSWSANSAALAKRAANSYFERMGGNYLPDGTNIDNLTKEHSGWWLYERANASGTFPTSDTYGTIGHIHGTSNNIAMQFIRSNSQAAVNRVLYVRYKMGGTWGAWQRFVTLGTTQLTINRTTNSYVNAAGMSNCYAYKKGGFLFFRGFITLSAALPAATSAQIATISNWTAPVSIFESVASTSYGREVASVSLSYDGKLSIRNNCSFELSNGASFQFTAMMLCTDGAE